MNQRALSSTAAAFAVLAVLLSAVSAPVRTSAAGLQTNVCSAAQLSDIMAVYLATPAPRATPMPIPAGAQTYLSRVLNARLHACRMLLPVDNRIACMPKGSESGDARRLWAHLNFCVALANPPPPAPAGVLWQVPGASGYQPIIFVMGSGADPTQSGIASKMVSTLTVFLNAGRDEAGYHFTDNALLIPEPTWQLADFAAQCAASSSVRGAIIANITAAGSGSSDEFISRRNWSALEATASYAQCSHASGAHGIAALTWVSGIEQQDSHRSVFTPLMPLAMLFTLGAMYEEFAPARTNATATTRVFRNPAAPSPPPSGRVTQIVTTNQTALNASSIGSVAGSFLGSSITYTNAAVPLTSTALDQQTWDTVESLAMKLITDMNCWQPSPEAIGTPPASDVTGAQRPLPAYNPPAGLADRLRGQYNTFGRTSAPFCAEPGRDLPGNHASIHMLLPGTPMPATTQPPRRAFHA